MLGAQTAKQNQSNGQKYQDERKDNLKLGNKSKTQKSVKHWHKIEEARLLSLYCALAGDSYASAGDRKAYQSSAMAGARSQFLAWSKRDR